MPRIAILTVELLDSPDKRIDLIRVLMSSAENGKSRAAKLDFPEGKSHYVCPAPGRYALDWSIEGEEGAFVELMVRDGDRLLFRVKRAATRIGKRGRASGYVIFILE